MKSPQVIVLSLFLSLTILISPFEAKADQCSETAQTEIAVKVLEPGAEKALGPATSEKFLTLDGIGCVQHFANGSVYWKLGLGPHLVLTSFRDFWGERGFEQNPDLGYPISDELFLNPDNADRFQDFENGVLYWKVGSQSPIQLGKFWLASRSKSFLENKAKNQVKGLMAPFGSKAYISREPQIVSVTDYSKQELDFVKGRQLQLELKIKYRAKFLGIDRLLPDPSTTLTLWLAFEIRKTGQGTELVMVVTRARPKTYVPRVTRVFVSANSINRKLNRDVLRDVIGKPQIVGTIPPGMSVVSVKIMSNGDLNIYLAPQ